MANWVTAYFETLGVAQTGLTAKAYVRDLADNSLAVNGATMSEIADGWYKLDWVDGAQTADYDITKSYVGYCDSQNADTDDRYVPIEFKVVTDVETIEAVDATDQIRDAVLNGTIDEAVVGSNPTTFKGKLQALWNRQFAKRIVTRYTEESYEQDDTTIMEGWDLTITKEETKRER